jgi:hypothetical protein
MVNALRPEATKNDPTPAVIAWLVMSVVDSNQPLKSLAWVIPLPARRELTPGFLALVSLSRRAP